LEFGSLRRLRKVDRHSACVACALAKSVWQLGDCSSHSRIFDGKGSCEQAHYRVKLSAAIGIVLEPY
jgi:hypothetical protein